MVTAGAWQTLRVERPNRWRLLREVSAPIPAYGGGDTGRLIDPDREIGARQMIRILTCQETEPGLQACIFF